MCIYENFVVNETEKGNYEVVIYSNDEELKKVIRINRNEVKRVLGDTNDEMLIILMGVIKLRRIYSFKKNSNNGFVKDITKTKDFKRNVLDILNVCSIEYLIERLSKMKYSEIITLFEMNPKDILDSKE